MVGHLLGNSCPLGWPYVLTVFCLFVFFIYFQFWLLELDLILIAPDSVHCVSITFGSYDPWQRFERKLNNFKPKAARRPTCWDYIFSTKEFMY